MGRGNGGGGGRRGAPPPSPAQAQEMAQAHAELRAMAAITAKVVRGFAPHITVEQSIELAEQAILEGQQLAPMLDDAVPGSPGLAMAPRWGYSVKNMMSVEQTEGRVIAPKQLDENSSMEDVVRHAQTLALATSIVGRAVLRAWGYKLEFFQAKPAKEGKILLPGD